jgi:hypothetical protein
VVSRGRAHYFPVPLPRQTSLAHIVAVSLLSLAQISQIGASAQRAADGMTAAEITRRIAIIADDSMRGRDTPSPQLEQVASWIAAEFRSVGLRPGGANGTFFQRYTLVRTEVDTAATYLALSRGSRRAAAVKAPGGLEILGLERPAVAGDWTGPVVLGTKGAARQTPGTWIVEPARPGLDALYDAVRRAYAAGAAGILLVASRSDPGRRALADDGVSAWRVEGEEPLDGGRIPVVLEIPDTAAARAFGLDAAMLRGDVPLPRDLSLTLHVARRLAARTTAPNVVAVLEGSDPKLAGQYVLLSAHMDHIGVASATNPACRAAGADSICNGADDDASGTVAVIEAARAFARLTPRPRRSLVFLTVSGEEKGLWGSEYFTGHPLVPLDSVVADLNVDMVGRNWTDTIAVIGKEQSSLGSTVDSVAAAHPELRMTPIRDPWPAENFFVRSDHYNFARRGVPILFFFNGVHADYHRVSDEVAKINGEKEARVVKLIFYTALALTEADGRPRWDPTSYRRVVEAAN